MGLKTLKAKYEEEKKQFQATIGAFVRQAAQINTHLTECKTKMDVCQKVSMEVAEVMLTAQVAVRALKT